jgi:hypothetical protein
MVKSERATYLRVVRHMDLLDFANAEDTLGAREYLLQESYSTVRYEGAR